MLILQHYKRITISLLLIFIFLNNTYAGVTGKIAGKVIDKTTREPLVGVNVVIVGTNMGASTNVDGNYTILNIPPGTYQIKASMIGYATTTITDVKVYIDLTTVVNIELNVEDINLGEVVIVSERKIIQKDMAGSTTSISTQDVQTLPVNSIQGVIGLQAGVESGFVIRGGTADQALFLIDGFAMRDARNNQPVTSVALSGIQEVALERGGFNAEYGQVRSGLLKIVTKEGKKDQYDASITFRISPPSKKYFDISPYDPNSYWLRPYLDPEVAFVGTKNGPWDEWTQRQYPVFDGWNAVSKRLFEDNDPSNDLSPAAAKRLFEWQHRKRPVNKPDYDIDLGFGGPVPLVSKLLGDLRFFLTYRKVNELYLIPLTNDHFSEENFSLKLNSNITSNLKFAFSTVLGNSNNIANNGTEQAVLSNSGGLTNSTSYIRTPEQIANDIQLRSDASTRIFLDSYYSLAKVNHYGANISLTHLISNSTFYDLSIDYFQRKYKTGPTRQRNDQPNYELFPGYFVSEAPFGWDKMPYTGIGDGIFFGGHTSTARDSTNTYSLALKFDLTSQVNYNNQVKTGFELVYNNLDLNFGVVNLVFPESNQRIKAKYNPLRAAFYLQDKLEFEGFIANLGVRFDYSNSRTNWPDVNPYDYNFFGSAFSDTLKYNTKPSKGLFTISPRLGISHPITENSKLFFNYGHFKQLPSYEQLFQLSRGATNQVRIFGDPNLNLANTISYELGYDQVLFEEYLLQISGFYRDVTDQVAVSRYISADGRVSYLKINTNNYEDIRGFELTLRKNQGNWVKGYITYTYQIVTQGRFGRDIVYEDPSQQRQFDFNTGNFLQNKPIPQPYANFVITFFTPSDENSNYLKKFLFNDLYLTLIGSWRAGYWVTRNPNNIPFVSQNVQAKDYYNLDLRFTKEFKLGIANLTFIMDISNVLNIRRFYGGFSDFQDLEDYWNSLHLPKSRAYNNIVGNDKYGDFRDPSVEYQPIIQVESVNAVNNPKTRPFYYEINTGKYMQYKNGSWQEVEGSVLKDVLDKKAYIDMPNQTSFTFLNPRNVFFGLQLTIKL